VARTRITTYSKMRTDAQIASLLLAFTGWCIHQRAGGGKLVRASWLRALYRHWIRKDRLLRVDAITGERNGSGVPIAYAPPGAAASRLRSSPISPPRTVRAEQPAGLCPMVRIFASAASRNVGRHHRKDPLRRRADGGSVAGNVHQARDDRGGIASTRPHSRRLLRFSSEAVAKHYADVTNEHVIEDLIDVN
jgi:hypothetical protein